MRVGPSARKLNITCITELCEPAPLDTHISSKKRPGKAGPNSDATNRYEETLKADLVEVKNSFEVTAYLIQPSDRAVTSQFLPSKCVTGSDRMSKSRRHRAFALHNFGLSLGR